MNPLASLAPALKDIASAQKSSFSATQAVWRFLNNEKVTFQQLNQPIQALAAEQLAQSNHDYALVVHDWSQLQYIKHDSKVNRLQKTHKYDKGYELQSSLLVDAASGLPIAPLAQTLSDASGRYSTFTDQHNEKAAHLNALSEQIEHIESLPAGKKLVHIIDREGDSAAHQRQLSQKGYCWLIRGKEGNTVEYQGQTLKAGEAADQLETLEIKTIEYKGKKARLHVGEAEVWITRDAKPKRKDQNGKRVAPEKEKRSAPG